MEKALQKMKVDLVE